MTEAYDGREVVVMDPHRRRSVLVRMTGRAARRTPGHTRRGSPDQHRSSEHILVQHSAAFLGSNCPVRSHRVKGGSPGRPLRGRTLETATAHKGFAPTRKTGRIYSAARCICPSWAFMYS
jgi:hypothetical protein